MAREVIIGAFALAIGALIGSSINSGNYLKGRFSACKDITTQLNLAFPVRFACVMERNEVYITSPLLEGKMFTLDGKTK